MAGVPLPKVSREDEAREARRKTLHEVMEIAAKFFEATLAAKLGARARGYLADRGLDAATQLKFRLGYAPGERFALKEHLGNQGVSVEAMVETGLLIAGDDIPVPYDRFRDRVMFPIADHRNRVIAFGGRALEKDAQAKYLNSPETPLFHKGGTLYNIGPARQAAHDGATVVAVEGYVDVIAMVSAGFPATVAPLGTALTEDQLSLIWKMADEPVLCFDGDNAGLRAAYRAVDLALPRLAPGKSLKFALLPQGPGPRRSAALGRARGGRRSDRGGAPACRHVVGARDRRARLRHAGAARGAGSARQRRHLGHRRRGGAQILPAGFFRPARAIFRAGASARPRARRAANWRGQQDWRNRRDRGWQPRDGLPARPAPGGKAAPYVVMSQQLAASPALRGHRSAIPLREALILQAALNHPWLLHDHLEELSQLEFRHPDTERLKAALIDIAAQAEAADAATVRAELAGRGLAEIMARIEAAITTASVWGAGESAAPDDVLVTWQQLVGLHRQWHSLVKELKDAEWALGQDNSESNYLRLVDVKARLARMEGTEALIEGFGASSGRSVRSL